MIDLKTIDDKIFELENKVQDLQNEANHEQEKVDKLAAQIMKKNVWIQSKRDFAKALQEDIKELLITKKVINKIEGIE